MTEESPRFTFEWRADEHARIVALLMREQFGRGIGRAAKWAAWVAVSVALLTVVATALAGDRSSVLQLAPVTFAAIVLLIALPGLTGRMRAYVVQRTDPNVGQPFTFEFRDTGLRILLHTVDSELRWEGMYRVVETSDMFLFYYNSRAAYFLPKRAVGDAPDVDALREWMLSNLPVDTPMMPAESG